MGVGAHSRTFQQWKLVGASPAVVFNDRLNEVLKATGRAWPLARESSAENNTIKNMDRLFAAAKLLA